MVYGEEGGNPTLLGQTEARLVGFSKENGVSPFFQSQLVVGKNRPRPTMSPNSQLQSKVGLDSGQLITKMDGAQQTPLISKEQKIRFFG